MLGGGLLNKHNSPKLQKFKEKDSKRKVIVTAIIISILLLSGVYLYSSFAVFSEEKNFNVINGTVSDPGDIYFAYYVDGEITRSMPKQNTGYTLNTLKSTCTNGVIPSWNNAGWKFIGDYHNYNATDYTRTKCDLYFEKTSKVVSTAIGNIEVNTYTPDFSKSACDDEVCESHEKGIYETQDDDGTSYYYRGSVENNYVKFAGYYWRIIRINGNGSIRMIYDGTVAHDNGESSTDREYGTSQFNPGNNDNMYVGYLYTSGNAHGVSIDSTIKVTNDNFYTSKISSYSGYLDNNAGFCGDRTTYNVHDNVGTGTSITYYAGNTRFQRGTPNLKCFNNYDYYTTSSAISGNKALTYPIALINLDEIILAGNAATYYDRLHSAQYNKNNYLAIGTGFWTMTPSGFFYLFSFKYSLATIYEKGEDVGETYPDEPRGFRPVINLKSTLKFTGDGTKNNPYVPSV